ncbi:TonB-dependent receptor [Novosphingobium sp. PhB165]|uniref:TonB-dependent receptor domain-containing protein n=1 Tax=Novosphingobium sp. PhB165 TaxID=2485105 RepID=UPI00140465C1|nr:TonB-dependent receptor [Novosphingobium sp. PhB165]
MAVAQSADQSNEGHQGDQPAASRETEIVVTGTLIRGIAPAGSNVIGITDAQAKATGAATANGLLSSLPTVGNFFNSVQSGVSGVAGSNGSTSIARPNLRNLPGANTSGGAQTLVLLDGHRVTPLGINQLAVDPDFIAPLVIERVEAMTDGGSAVYGSDALGGVINFMTRSRYDGVQLDAKVGIGDSYTSYQAGGIAGKDWGSGSAYIAYRYSQNDALFGSDRDYVHRIDPLTGIPTGRNCAEGVNVSAGSGAAARNYIMNGANLAVGGPITCDYAQDVAIYPSVKAHNVFASLMQKLDDNLQVDLKFYYANRQIRGNNGTLGNGQLGTGAESMVTLAPSNPNYHPLPVGDPNFGMAQTVRFSLADALGARSSTQNTNLDTWNVTPQLTWKFGHDWQLRALANYGRGTVDYENAQLVNARGNSQLQNAANTGALNPYNVGATSQSVLDSIVGYDVGIGRNEYANFRAILDGPIVSLPAGDLRAALGAEYSTDTMRQRTTNVTTYTLLPPRSYTQTVKSLFGELQVPVLGGGDNDMSLVVAASARYDKYNDFGDTFNPKFGITFEPFNSLTLRANWGKSFNAATPADQLGVYSSIAQQIPGAFLQFPPPTPGVCGVSGLPACASATAAGIYLNGAVPGLQPQKATNWSAGFDFRPIDRVTLSASYYSIDLKGTIGRPVSGSNLTDFYMGYPDLWLFQPSGEQVARILATIPAAGVGVALANPTSTSQALLLGAGGSTTPVQVLLDTRAQNLGRTKLSGIDFSANFDFDTSWGSIDGRVAGNYRLTQKNQSRPGIAWFDVLQYDTSKYQISTNLGTTMGQFRAQATWNLTPGYTRSANVAGQKRVSDFNIVNLYFGYDFKGSGLANDLSVTLNFNNIFDEEPPVYLDAGQPGYLPGNTFTLGRMVQLGLSKKF